MFQDIYFCPSMTRIASEIQLTAVTDIAVTHGHSTQFFSNFLRFVFVKVINMIFFELHKMSFSVR